MKQIRVAVIGIGNMGAAHATCIAEHKIEGMVLTAVCDISEHQLTSFKEKYPYIKYYTSTNALFSDRICDSVVIAVPHPLHAEIAMEAFRHNLHVMLEKPVDITVSKAEKMNELAKKTDRVFSVMLNQRTNPLFSKAREIVKSGQLGELKRTVWTVTNWFRTQSYYNSGHWRATWSGEGGGVLLNQAPHNLDVWQWICGMPKSVTAFCSVGKHHHIEVEDDVTIFTRYENGATGVFITSTGEYPGTNRLEISGNLGKLLLENGMLKWYRLKEPINHVIKNSKEGFAQIDYDYQESKQIEPELSHKGILQNFANAILAGEKLIAPGTDGINELMISNAAYLSQWQSNSEVFLPIDAKLFDELLEKKMKSSNYKPKESVETGNMSYLTRWQVRW